MNGVNLNHFQFEYDLTWMAFFQDSNGHTYTRYGGREDSDAESHLSKASLASTMKTVLELHKTNSVKPESKYEPRPADSFIPEDIPLMKRSLSKRKDSCIHCHEVKATQLKQLAKDGRLDKAMVFTYPSPSQLGIVIDADQQTLIRNVTKGSFAEKAGIEQGDEILEIERQPVFTFADFTRILELSPNEGKIAMRIQRNDLELEKSLTLESGWKKLQDPSWRASTSALGPSSGFWGVKLDDSQKKKLDVNASDLAVKVNFIWGAWAKKAGFKHGDIVVSINNHTDDMTIRQLQSYLHLNLNYGDSIPVEILRGKKRVKMTVVLPTAKDDD